MNPLCVLASLVAAACFATASVAQHQAASRAPAGTGSASGLRLALRLATSPLWLLGVVTGVVGFAAQALALATGPLVVVQLLLVSGLLLALPVALVLERRRPQPTEWVWALAVGAGLVAFLLGSTPSPGSRLAPSGLLAAGVAACAGAAVLAVLVARLVHARYRALLLGLAGGTCFGAAGALLKQVVGQVDLPGARGALPLAHAALALAGRWTPWALALTGLAGVVLTQASYRAGVLAAAQPAITIAEPLAAAVLGAVAFAERVDSSPAALALQALGVAAMVAGVVGLARAAHTAGPEPPGGGPPGAGPLPTPLAPPAVAAAHSQEEQCSPPPRTTGPATAPASAPSAGPGPRSDAAASW